MWQVPIDTDGDGEFDDQVAISYEASLPELIDAGVLDESYRTAPGKILERLDETLTAEEWSALGGLHVGGITELNNTAEHPFLGFVEQMVENSVLFPWLLNEEIMALTGAAWLEGRALSQAELIGTEWWQTHSESERQWLMLNSQSPEEAKNLMRDNRIMVLDMLQEAGVSNAPNALVNLLADRFTRGTWSQVYLTNQVGLISDPGKRGKINEAVTAWLNNEDQEGFTINTTQSRQDKVRELVDSWLGPALGGWDDRHIDRWAERFRNDPDAETTLTENLSKQRLTMLPGFKDPTARYDDIAGPWRTIYSQEMGEMSDETDGFFIDVINSGNVSDAQRLLRQHGVSSGNRYVTDRLMNSMMNGFGGQIVRAQ
ncbi:MAG: hypothetical protein ABIJ75_05915 [Actinomycetota bacterium]